MAVSLWEGAASRLFHDRKARVVERRAEPCRGDCIWRRAHERSGLEGDQVLCRSEPPWTRNLAKAGGLGRRTLGLETDRLAAKVLPDSPAATAQQFAAPQ
jgi:hypothetical protein